MLIPSSKKGWVASVPIIVLIGMAIMVSSTFPVTYGSYEEARCKAWGVWYIYNYNGTMITIEKEWEERKISETAYGEIWETIPETVKILKYEVIQMQISSNPAPTQQTGVDAWGSIIWSDLPAKSYQSRQVYFGITYTSAPIVTLGGPLAYGDYAHIEDPSNPNSGLGITTTYFWFRGYTNDAGKMGTCWRSIGPTS